MTSLRMARVILFTGKIDAMREFYGKVLGLKQVIDEKGWREFEAGKTRIALHFGPASPGRKGPKIVFCAEDVAAVREKPSARGAKFGKVRQFAQLISVTAKIPTAIQSNSPIDKRRI